MLSSLHWIISIFWMFSMLTQSSFLFRKKCTVSIQDDFTELEIVRLYETRLRLSTMLIVTESINADREPNKTHNEIYSTPAAASGHCRRDGDLEQGIPRKCCLQQI